MAKWIACGAFNNPKTAREYIQFSSKVAHDTQEGAQAEANLWEAEARYKFIWVEGK